MKVEEIPADQLVEMTELFHRSFKAAGCDPECHCCANKIPIGAKFKLATVMQKPTVWGNGLEKGIDILKGKITTLKDMNDNDMVHSHEVMLCEVCTPVMYHEKVIKELEGKIAERDKPRGGCFRINGKIVH